MILVDTNIWIDYFRGKKIGVHLSQLLADQQVISHSWIRAELALGHLGPKREGVLRDLALLPQCQIYHVDELIHFSHRERLFGKGLSLIDLHLLFAAIIERCSLWSADRALHNVALSYGCAYSAL